MEAVKDPLTHLLRNAIDHGLEKPEARLARGKPAEGRRAGLVVGRILDTVEGEAALRPVGHRPGVAGSAVIGRRVTDLLDVAGVLRNLNPEDGHA